MAVIGCVLIIDAEIANWTSLGEALRDVEYDVMAAVNGAEAFTLMTERLPDILLLDMRMPALESWAFTESVRSRWGSSVPIAMMTAGYRERLWAGELAADAVLPKPFDLGQLYAVVRRLTHARTIL